VIENALIAVCAAGLGVAIARRCVLTVAGPADVPRLAQAGPMRACS
jgi:hypothetical protein